MGKTAANFKAGTLRRWWRNNPIIRFCVFFCLTLGAFSAILRSDVVQIMVFTPHLRQIAGICSAMIHAFGTTCSTTGTTIISERFSMEVVPGCDSLYPTALLWAGVIAYPAGVKSKLMGLAGGAVILFLLNIIRVTSMFYVGYSAPAIFDFMHVYAWQALFILVTLSLWLLWVANVSHD